MFLELDDADATVKVGVITPVSRARGVVRCGTCRCHRPGDQRESEPWPRLPRRCSHVSAAGGPAQVEAGNLESTPSPDERKVIEEVLVLASQASRNGLNKVS